MPSAIVETVGEIPYHMFGRLVGGGPMKLTLEISLPPLNEQEQDEYRKLMQATWRGPIEQLFLLIRGAEQGGGECPSITADILMGYMRKAAGDMLALLAAAKEREENPPPPSRN